MKTNRANSEIPKGLIDQIKEGNVVLFLGAGASIDAIHSKGEKAPTGRQLANLIAEKFLGDEYKEYDLQYVSELAISERDLVTVQKFVYDIFTHFEPGEPHLRIPLYKWNSIFTTNYDLVIERAYEQTVERQQELAVFIKNSERVNDKMSTPNSVMYNKLHGSITEIYDKDLPLILTPDQYIDHKKNRDRLFYRLEEASREYSILFIGVSFADADIRQALKFLDNPRDTKPRSYMVGPNITDIDQRLWEGKKISSIKLTFKDFMEKIKSEISESERILSQVSVSSFKSHPIMSKFTVSVEQLPSLLTEFLTRDAIFIHKNLATKDTNPRDFYKGYFENWDPILKDFDIRREVTDLILSEVFLIDDEERLSLQDFYLIKGNAGSGKSVLIHRLAWDAAVDFDKLSLFYQSDVSIEYNRLAELYQFVKERIYLFVDNVNEKAEDIEYILKKAKKDNIFITIIGCERTNVWNMQGSLLNNYLIREYELKYLNDEEIDLLIDKLTLHKSLGYLANKDLSEQREALAEKSNRELLVALHEATAGKPFEDIVINEYNSIPDDEAKDLYLSICVFHRIGTYARAGIISRLHNINFSYFKDKLFMPLESIVYHHRNYVINDYVYTTRHQYIAELVFEHILVNQELRLNKYISVISKLDFGYDSDRQLFIALTKAKQLIDTFKDPEYIRQIYDVACENIGEEPALLQQEAIFEMTIEGGNLERARELLQIAAEEEPHNTNISHSKAEYLLKKAEKATQPLSIKALLTSAKNICKDIIRHKKNRNTVRAYHTLLKIYITELETLLLENNPLLINKKIQEFEKIISEALQTYPKDSFILEAEASFNDLFDRIPEALLALETAYQEDKRSPYLSTRLANYYIKNDNIKDAMIVLKDSVALNLHNKNLNFKYTKLLMQTEPENYTEIKHYLRKSFVKNDKRYEAQFWYARLLYLMSDKEYQEYFNYLKDVPLDFRIKKQPHGIVTEQGKDKAFEGTISKLESSYGFIKEDLSGEFIYFARESENDSLRKSMRVKYRKAFNYNGPIAIID